MAELELTFNCEKCIHKSICRYSIGTGENFLVSEIKSKVGTRVSNTFIPEEDFAIQFVCKWYLKNNAVFS